MSASPVVLVTVGTDHHQIDRLMDWIDEYARTREGRVKLIVQYGYSRAPSGPNIEATQMLPFDEFQELLRTVDVLVTPGPTTIMEALEYGLTGICTPRELARDEHVDNNQVTFAKYFAAQGKFHLPDGKDELFALLDAAIVDPTAYRFDPAEVPLPPGIARIGAVVDALVWDQPIPGE
jgi:UDP-N-acetylglucosamine transferase subunit ALG13